jgi:hypothetical protein
LSVEEPAGDLVLGGVLDDGNDALEFFGCEFTSTISLLDSVYPTQRIHCQSVPLVQVDICLLADQVGVTTSDTLDFGQGVHDLLLSVDIGVEETENELEVRLLSCCELVLLPMH